jgi:hypothetical protein
LAFESFTDWSERLDIVGLFLKWNAYLLSVRGSGGGAAHEKEKEQRKKASKRLCSEHLPEHRNIEVNPKNNNAHPDGYRDGRLYSVGFMSF